MAMHRVVLLISLLSLPAFAQTHVFHTPIPMDEVQGVFALQGNGSIDFNLSPLMRVGGFLDLWRYRGRLSASTVSGGGANPFVGVCYAAVGDYMGWTFKDETTYRIRYGAGGGLQLCYLRDSLGHDTTRVLPVFEGLASLQFRVVPNILGDVSVSGGWPEGIGASVSFGFGF